MVTVYRLTMRAGSILVAQTNWGTYELPVTPALDALGGSLAALREAIAAEIVMGRVTPKGPTLTI